MDDQRILAWTEVSQKRDIDDFYNLIKNDDVTLLEHIDELPFVHTPLHILATAGHIEFSIEMMKLKPSFISKQNADGHTPIYLALLNRNTELVRQLLQHNVDLVRVKGRQCRTPLHDAATNIGREDPNHPDYEARNNYYLALLENFLSVCPDSITDVTSRNETALHIAVKHHNLEAFKFLVGWVLRKCPDWKKILAQKDVDGNTILHIAASKNHTLAVSHLFAWGATFFIINEKNLKGKTALDILHRQQTPDSEEQQTSDLGEQPRQEVDNSQMRDILERARAEGYDSSHEDYLGLPGSCERRKIIFIGKQVRKRISEEKRNALLVVAALLVTVTYQAILSPPGGLWQDNDLSKPNTTTAALSPPSPAGGLFNESNSNITAPHRAGSAIARGTFPFSIFMAFNSIIFLSSIATMAVLVPPDGVVGAILTGVAVSLCFGYFSSLMIITQAPDWLARIVLISPLIIVIVGAALIIIRKDSRIKW